MSEDLEVSCCSPLGYYIPISFRLLHFGHSFAHLFEKDCLLLKWVFDEGGREVIGVCYQFIDGFLGPEAQYRGQRHDGEVFLMLWS